MVLTESVTSNQSALKQSSLVLQYAAMFVSAGEAGDAKKVQTSVAAARKVFRIFRVSCSIDSFFVLHFHELLQLMLMQLEA